jgi:hypothetical protein
MGDHVERGASSTGALGESKATWPEEDTAPEKPSQIERATIKGMPALERPPALSIDESQSPT